MKLAQIAAETDPRHMRPGAHNPKVAGSNPAPATSRKPSKRRVFGFSFAVGLRVGLGCAQGVPIPALADLAPDVEPPGRTGQNAGTVRSQEDRVATTGGENSA